MRRYPGTDDVDVVVPWDEVVAWRVACQCGWTGEQQPAYLDVEYGTRDCPEEVEDRIFAPAWDDHVAAFVFLTELDELTGQLRDIEDRIDACVQRARKVGATWDQISHATRTSTQAASHRWGSVAPEPQGA